MSERRRNTSFYVETLILVLVFMLIILVLTRVFGAARTNHGKLDLLRAKFPYGKSRTCASHERRTACLPRGERSCDVLPEPNGLDSHARRLITRNDRADLVVNLQQAR